jgi:phosphoribosylaminoimidazole-succinocarboxamide synthase
LQGCNAGQGKKDDAELLSSVTHQLNDFTMAQALTTTDLQGALPLIARGKVRDLYEIDDKTLLFVASDRISAYDVIMENVYNSPHQYDCLLGLLANARSSAK